MNPAEGETTEPASNGPRSLREYVNSTLISLVPPLIAYYGLRATGLTQWLALVGAIVTAVVQGLITMARKRKFEPMNGLAIVAATVSLIVAFSTKNPRIVQLTELIPATVAVVGCLVSGLLGRPMSKQVAGVIVPGLADRALPERGWTDQDIRNWHTLHVRLCVSLGLLCSLFPFLAVYLVFNLPVDVSQALLVSLGSGLLVFSIATAIAFLRKFVLDRDRAVSARSDQPGASSAARF